MLLMKIKKIIKNFFGTENDILLKFSLSCFFTGILFMIFAFLFQNDTTQQPTKTFTYISGILFAIWLISIENENSIKETIKELFRLIFSFVVLILALDFCLNQSIHFNGLKLISYSLLSCIGILSCIFYLISKFIDILKLIKKIIIHLKNKLLNTEKQTPSKIKSLIENTTAFLLAISGLGVAIKAIIVPLINLVRNLPI